MRGEALPAGRPVVVGSLPAGVEELFRSEYDPMYRLAFTLLGTDDDAEEVVQEAFLGVAARWDELENPGGYLRVSVVNGARKRMRSHSRRRRAESKLGAAVVVDLSTDDDYLLDVVDALPERQRTAVVLSYYSGLDSAVVGELMGCRPATVRSLVRHALKTLREVIER